MAEEGASNLTELLLHDIELNLELVVNRDVNKEWGKSLKYLPSFTIREIEEHRKNSGKSVETAIIKTLDRGRKFKSERYISADTVFTAAAGNLFFVKCKCKASMKRDLREVEVALNQSSGCVVQATCSCPAGASGYCNHVMGLLFELADYSLNELSNVPEEIACTSRLRQWGVPTAGESSRNKDPIMTSPVRSDVDKKGIHCTIFDPRINFSTCDIPARMETMKESLQKIDNRIGFAHCIDMSTSETNSTKYGEYIIGSTLSHQLLQIESNLEVVTNICVLTTSHYTDYEHISLPFEFIGDDSIHVPRDWGKLTYTEMIFFDKLKIEESDAIQIEQNTLEQSGCQLWFSQRKNRITSSNAHRILTRKRNFESLADDLMHPKNTEELPQFVQDAMKHGRIYEPVARDLYKNYLKYNLKHDIHIRETGIIIQPNLFWLAASPDGLFVDVTEGTFGVVEIKCPKTKKHATPKELLSDETFYVHLVDGKPELKKFHANGYYTQIQMSMGLSGVRFCDFIVYTFKGLIIIRTPFDEKYFEDLVKKLNTFYRQYVMKKLIVN